MLLELTDYQEELRALSGAIKSLLDVDVIIVDRWLTQLVNTFHYSREPLDIRVNSIAPGVIDTDMCANLSADTRAMLRDETPLERLGQPDDVAKAAEYLADADFITGQVLAVNGGFVIT